MRPDLCAQGKNSCRQCVRLLAIFLLLAALTPKIGVSTGLETPGGPNPVDHLKTMPNQPFFWEVLVAALLGWVIGVVKGFSGSREWLSKYWKTPPVVLIFLLDLAVYVGVGGFFGTGIYNPTNFLSALAAGLSWPVGLGALVTKD